MMIHHTGEVYEPRESCRHHRSRSPRPARPSGEGAALPEPQSRYTGGAARQARRARAQPSRPRVCQARPALRAATRRGRTGGRPGAMARILRGDIVWADLNPVRGREQAGRRPVVVISEDIFNARSGTVIALAITSQAQRAGFPLTLELTTVQLPKRSWVKISQVRTLSVERVGKKIARIAPEELDRLIEGLNEIVGA